MPVNYWKQSSDHRVVCVRDHKMGIFSENAYEEMKQALKTNIAVICFFVALAMPRQQMAVSAQTHQ